MNRTIIITGATSGIGTYLSHYYGKKGYTLFLHGRDKRKLDKLRTELSNPNASYLRADFTSPRDLQNMFTAISKKAKKVDVLINNAFGKLEDPIDKADPAAIITFFQVSLAGTAEIIRRSLPLLKKSKEAHIINIVADWGFPMHNIMTGPSLYIAAKYGVHGLGAALQTEVSKMGIRTTNVCPGIVAADTRHDTTEKSFEKAHGAEAIHPMDIAHTIDYVLDQRYSHVRTIILSPVNPNYNGL